MSVCAINGNSDMYGLGIRIGFYLQWFGAILASWLTPAAEVASIRLTICLFTAATFLALLIQIIRSPSSLEVVEIYVILLLTFGYYLFRVPIYIWRIITCCHHALDPWRFPLVPPGRIYSVLNFVLLNAVAAFQLWFWFAHVPNLNGKECIEFGFFFARFKLNEKGFRILNIVFYNLLLLSCTIVPFLFAGLKLGIITERTIPQLSGNYIRGLRILHSITNTVVASTVLIATELTIRWNAISGVNSLSSAGQIIPLFLGIGIVVRIFYVYFVLTDDIEEEEEDSRRTYPQPEFDTNSLMRGNMIAFSMMSRA